MIYRVPASKDTSLVLAKVQGAFVSSSNVGASEILRLFATHDPNQISNIAIAFNTSSAISVFSSSYRSGSISWRLIMSNVETENPNIGSFDIEIIPLEQDWDEGKGHDFDYYTDSGFASYVEAKRNIVWSTAGGKPSGLLSSTFHFESGHEDLDADVTTIAEAAQYGLWVGVSSGNLADGNDYYLKAFRSRQTHVSQYQPYLEARWNDSTGSYNSAFIDIIDATGALDGGIYNLKRVYDRMESPILRTHFRPRDWNLAIVTTGSADASGTILTNAYYRVIETHSDDVVIPFGTGSELHTKLSYNDDGNYFKFAMQNLASGLIYRFDIGYYDIAGEWHVHEDESTFRVK